MNKIVKSFGFGCVLVLVVSAAPCRAGSEASGSGVRVSERFGYDAEDATEILQRAFNSGERKLILDKPIWYARPLYITKPNLELVIPEGVTLMAKRGEFHVNDERLLLIEGRGVTNVTIRGGGRLAMWKCDYTDPKKYAWGEWRHTLAMHGVRNVTIRDLTIESSGGDGIYVRDSKDVFIGNVRSTDHNRQGISVIGAENLLVTNCVFELTDGTAPQCGLDIEPNHERNPLKNILFTDCQFPSNAMCGVLVHLAQQTSNSAPVSITFRNCRSFGNKGGGYRIYGGADKGSPKGTVTIENCVSEDNATSDLVYDHRIVGGVELVEKGCDFKRRSICTYVRPENAAPLDFMTLKPPSKRNPAKELSTGRIRRNREGDTTFVQWVPAAGSYRVRFVCSDVGKQKFEGGMEVQDRAGTHLADVALKRGVNDYTIDAKGENTYRFIVRMKNGTTEFRSAYAGAGVVANAKTGLFASPGRRYAINVPAGEAPVKAYFQPEEPYSAKLLDPSGRVVASMADSTDSKILTSGARPKGSPASVWRVEIPRNDEDLDFRIVAPCEPVAWLCE